MSLKYDEYLSQHISCVKDAIKWMLTYIPSEKIDDIFTGINLFDILTRVSLHDESKFSPQEYHQYDNYFYGEKTEDVKKDFDYAWLHHIHNNPHHWQYWMLKDDDAVVSGNFIEVKCLEIPDIYVIEMIADWWSFSWRKYYDSGNQKDLYEIFNWYEEHEHKIAMNPKTKAKVVKLLDLIRSILDENTTNF